ncbi:heparin lyase I family protein [Cerasicoccus maritimus]|uniref:heparin lyase I family protein n=1 Tax=Cerasicoccus maritimus TaxID=490089 RepID=UPI002852C4A3|nr:heparin lyase I family protein [Cerasicoccus maritimus]
MCKLPVSIALGLSLAFSNFNASAQTASEDFEDGSVSPFNIEVISGNTAEIITPTGFPARSGSKVHHFVWNSANYNGNRSSKSVEGSSGFHLDRITGEGWLGFSLYAPESFPTPGKAMVLGQIHAWHSSLPATNITITVGVEASGALILEGAYGVGDGSKTVTVYSEIAPQLTKGEWHDLILYCKLSRAETGILRAWYDGAPEALPTVEYTGINLGNGAWTSDEEMTNGAYVKWGPYCWDHSNYDANESREIFYDDIAYFVGNPTNAFDLVKPTDYGTGYTMPELGDAVFTETYNEMTTGSWPTGWSVGKDSSTNIFVRESPSATDKSMQFYDGNPVGEIEAWRSIPDLTAPFNLHWSFKQTGGGSLLGEGHHMGLLSGSDFAVELLTLSGYLVYRDGDNIYHALAPVATGAWHDVDVVVNPVHGVADVYLNGVRVLSGASFTMPANTFDGLLFGTSNESYTHHLYINDIVISNLAPILDESFNEMETRSRPETWIYKMDSSTNVAVRETPSATDKSVQLWDGNTNGYPRMWKSFVPQSNPVTASWSFRENGIVDGHVMRIQSGETPAIDLVTDGLGNLLYRQADGSDVILSAIPANNWHLVEATINPATDLTNIYVNGVLCLEDAALSNPVDFVDRVYFGSSDTPASYHLYVNDVRIDSAEIQNP